MYSRFFAGPRVRLRCFQTLQRVKLENIKVSGREVYVECSNKVLIKAGPVVTVIGISSIFGDNY